MSTIPLNLSPLKEAQTVWTLAGQKLMTIDLLLTSIKILYQDQ